MVCKCNRYGKTHLRAATIRGAPASRSVVLAIAAKRADSKRAISASRLTGGRLCSAHLQKLVVTDGKTTFTSTTFVCPGSRRIRTLCLVSLPGLTLSTTIRSTTPFT